MGNPSNGTGGEEAAKAKGFHKNLCSLKFVIWLGFMNDFLAPLATLSRAFQSDKLLIYQVPSKIAATLLALTAFKSDPGIHMSTFLEKIDIEGTSFRSITLADEEMLFPFCSDYQTLVAKLRLDELLENTKK